MRAKAGHVHWRHNDWFPVAFYAFCPDKVAWEKERAKALKDCHIDIGDYPVEQGCAIGMTTNWKDSRGRAHVLIALSDKLGGDLVGLVNSIAHECVHAAHTVIDAMQDDDPSEEFMAYLVGGLAEDIFRDYSATRVKA